MRKPSLGAIWSAGENIIIDAICSVPYLTEFIYNYRDALINRERRVKELFKNFEDRGWRKRDLMMIAMIWC